MLRHEKVWPVILWWEAAVPVGRNSYCSVTKQLFATLRACLRINLRKESKMEYLSRGFKSVLGNQQAGSQPSAHETVRIVVFVRDLYLVILSDIDSYRAHSFRLRDCVTVLLPRHF